MKSKFSGLVVALYFLFSCTSPLSAAEDISGIIQKALPGVVVVIARSDSAQSLGSGFFVTANGDIVTNHHVIEEMTAFAIITNGGKSYPAKVRAYDKERDIAILATSTPSSEYSVLPLASQIPAIGTYVCAIGAPKGLDKTVSDGLVSQTRKIGDTQYLQVSCPISPGSSGGPIINTKGEVVGMATLYLESGQNLNFAVPSPTLKSFIEYGKNLDPINFPPSSFSSPAPAQPPKSPPTTEKKRPQERYVYLYTHNNDNVYIDTFSVQTQQGSAFFWITHKLGSESSLDFSRKTLQKRLNNITLNMECELNLATTEMRALQVIAQDERGQVIHKNSSQGSWITINPSAPGYKIFEFIRDNYY